VPEDKIKVTGNMKFDLEVPQDNMKDLLDLRRAWGIKEDDLLWVAASTHPGEEALLIDVYIQLLSEFPKLRLLLAPRHPERVGAVVRLIKKRGFKAVRSSQLMPGVQPATIFLLDTVGELLQYYRLADIVFVGGSLVKKGGHNILEPGALGKPVLFGPYIHNFRQIVELFLQRNAAIMVRNDRELILRIRQLLIKPALTLELANRAQQVIFENQGASHRTLQCIRQCLSSYGSSNAAPIATAK
jgi:3-deoxy-D-manno-octulosonic-acid transferase